VFVVTVLNAQFSSQIGLRAHSMRSFLKDWAITTLAVLIAAQVVSGICFTRSGLVLATLALGILNAVVRPILVVVSLPVIVLSFGLFIFVINALLLYAVGHMKNFQVNSFSDAFYGSLIISFVSMVLNWLTKSERRTSRRPRRRRPPPPTDSGKGPIIDV
jgi:putative membrane protein